jgi:hypothetical protein
MLMSILKGWSAREKHLQPIGVLVFLTLIGGLIDCATSSTAKPKSPTNAEGQSSQPAPHNTPVAEETNRPVELRISDLTVDPEKTVRISGTIASIEAMRLVPPKVIFKITDSTETITVLINEQVTLKEGMRIELVGRYKNIPSPSHSGPGEPPREAIFVVERFIDLP